MANVASSGVPEGITTSDGVPLKVSLARATRRQRIQALVLVLPLLLFLLVAFVLPIGEMLFRSFYSPVGSSVMPSFTKVIKDWDGEGLPPEATFEVFVKDMTQARESNEIGKTIGNLATRINYEIPGSRGLFTEFRPQGQEHYRGALQGSPDRIGQAAGKTSTSGEPCSGFPPITRSRFTSRRWT